MTTTTASLARMTTQTLVLPATDEEVKVLAVYEDGQTRLSFLTPLGYEAFSSTDEAVEWFGPMAVQSLIRLNRRHGELVA